MQSLRDKLRALGVNVGAQVIFNTNQDVGENRSETFENFSILGGNFKKTSLGNIYSIENTYSRGYKHGNIDLMLPSRLDIIAKWAKDEKIPGYDESEYMFIDTETTGLSIGAGTYLFLVGIGRFINGDFFLTQYFMHDPEREPALLAAIEENTTGAIISFNGKAFDIPLLNARYRFHQWVSPFGGLAHIDLLHLSRRLWRHSLPSRTLLNLEAQILGHSRTDADIPGWMIPQIYFDYLNTGDVTYISRVIYHNAMDILSLATLFFYVAEMVADPLSMLTNNHTDLLALGTLYQDLNEISRASHFYNLSIARNSKADEPTHASYLHALIRLASLYKRQREWPNAVLLWEEATALKHIPSFIELAKFYEHQEKNYSLALSYTQKAIDLLYRSDSPPPGVSKDIQLWGNKLQHRKRRLLSRLEW